MQDIKTFMRSEKKSKTNQEVISIKYLFYRFTIKAQIGTNFQISKYVEYNRMLINNTSSIIKNVRIT